MTATTRAAVGVLLDAIESRDLRAVQRALGVDASWQNVPHEVVRGRDAVVEMLAPILGWSDTVRWEVQSASYGDGRAWVERVDRFVIDGEECAVACNGVFGVGGDGLVDSVRDYVDLGEWRARIGPVYARMARRAPLDVVARHLGAVTRLDPVAMAADYAADAELVRGPTTYRGRFQIADYFDSVPERLQRRRLHLGTPVMIPSGEIEVPWSIDTSPARGDHYTIDTTDSPTSTTGTDRYVVEDGRIARQAVTLHGDDF